MKTRQNKQTKKEVVLSSSNVPIRTNTGLSLYIIKYISVYITKKPFIVKELM